MHLGKKYHKVSLASASWTMHEFFTGSGLVAYGLKDMFRPVWANDIPCQDLSLAGSLGGIDAERSGLVWEWLRILEEMPEKPALLLIENVTGLLSSNSGANYTKLHYALLGLGYKSGAI